MAFRKLPKIILASLFALLGWLGLHSPAEAQPMPWEDPAYETNIRATMAESRPGPDQTGWTA